MLRILPLFFHLLLWLGLAVFARADRSEMEAGGWEAIPQEELDAKAPRIDPAAGAEFLYREVRIDDADPEETEFAYHNRAKIFTEAGVLKWDKIDLIYQKGWHVYMIRARVVYPDGSVVLLDKKDIFSRQIYKDERFEGNAKSFSFPGLKPGCIVEYRWKMSRAYWTPSLQVPVRAEWPTWNFHVNIRPYSEMASQFTGFYCAVALNQKGGRYDPSIRDQPAISSKSHLPPRKDFEPWIYLGYATELERLSKEEYWGYRGGALVETNKKFVKAKQRPLKELAETLFAGLETADEKFRAAYRYCSEEIVNIESFTTRYTEEEIKELKPNKSPKDTIGNGYGTRYDVNALFASLLAAGDFEPRLAMVENHQEYTFVPHVAGEFNLPDWVVSVADGPNRRYFDPGSSFLPFEHLNPENVAANAIVTDSKYYYMIKTGPVEVNHSVSNRIGNLEIDQYGDLSGMVKVLYRGYASLWRKRLFASLTPKEREEYVLENDWRNRFPRAGISDFEMEHHDNREDRLFVKFTLKIPGFADLVGDRIVVNPNLFEYGKATPFTDETRAEPIAFSYIFRIQDKVRFKIPEGFRMENETTPSIVIEKDVVRCLAKGSFEEESRQFVFERLYEQRITTVDPKYYGPVKALFEEVSHANGIAVGFARAAGLASNSDR